MKRNMSSATHDERSAWKTGRRGEPAEELDEPPRHASTRMSRRMMTRALSEVLVQDRRGDDAERSKSKTFQLSVKNKRRKAEI